MTDDVVSISTRTNKLILTSENSANMLKDNIADFRLVINDIDERTRELTAQTNLSSIHSNLEDLNKFVYDIQNSVENNTEYNKVVNESLLAIAEWVDNAGATLSSLDAKIEKIDNIEEVKKLIKNIEKPAEFDYSIIQTLDSKLNQQQERIDSLESKLDRILELVEANDCAPITKKLGGVDRQLAKLNKSIERLTAYVNEE
jgi:chromosome segregation ATPase